MAERRNLVGELFLRAPKRLGALGNIPVLGQFLRRLSHQLLPAGENLWVQVSGGPARGLWLELNPRTGRDYWRGTAEPAVQTVLKERLQRGMVFYDIGANIGFFTLLGACLVGNQGRVFAFEPDAGARERLKRNVARNRLLNVSVVNAGVLSATGTARFVPSDSTASPDRGLGRFVTGEAGGSSIAVACVALDDFLRSAPPPDAIKCDVEGAEVEVLRGGKTLLAKHRPWIVCEVHSEANRESLQELLGGLGYSVEAVGSNHVLAFS